MEHPVITPQLTTSEILRRWPETITIFRENAMSCIGCYMSVFDTLEDAAIVHDIQVDQIVADLNAHIAATKSHYMDENYE
jgi:hybrid cluster-associated redox disulfide protein